jgi:hypothetical protein
MMHGSLHTAADGLRVSFLLCYVHRHGSLTPTHQQTTNQRTSNQPSSCLPTPSRCQPPCSTHCSTDEPHPPFWCLRPALCPDSPRAHAAAPLAVPTTAPGAASAHASPGSCCALRCSASALGSYRPRPCLCMQQPTWQAATSSLVASGRQHPATVCTATVCPPPICATTVRSASVCAATAWCAATVCATTVCSASTSSYGTSGGCSTCGCQGPPGPLYVGDVCGVQDGPEGGAQAAAAPHGQEVLNMIHPYVCVPCTASSNSVVVFRFP